MDFKIILACDANMRIGNSKNTKNTIPWKISEDMKHFKNVTSGNYEPESRMQNAIIMGRNTADTFERPLPNRLNVVITSCEDYRTREGFISYHDLDYALEKLSKKTDIGEAFVIGGARLAETAVNHKNYRGLYLTYVNAKYECDVFLSDEFFDKAMGDPYVSNKSKQIVHCKNANKQVEITFITTYYYNKEEGMYLDLLEKIIQEGDYRETRNAKTYSIFGEKLVFDLANGFPLLTTKKMFIRGILEELIFFLRGYTDTKILEDKKVKIWHDNTTKEFIEQYNKDLEEYDMGPMYGFQWRHFNAPYKGCHESYKGLGVDQLEDAINKLVKDPHSRRILMTTYNPAQSELGVLYPCHGLMIQFYVEKDNKITLQMYQR